MSSLILYEDRPERRQKLAAFFEHRAGHYEDIALAARPGFRLMLWSAETRSTAFRLDLGGGDFIAVAGSFFYDGQYGEAAARAFHAAFDPATFKWKHTSGQYVLALAKAGHIHVVNDSLAAWNVYQDTDGSYAAAGFLEALILTERPTFDAQGIYEYVFVGFALGATSFVSEIRALMPYRILTLGEDGRFREQTQGNPIERAPMRDVPLEGMAAYQLETLTKRFDAYAPIRGTTLISSLSGGFDSRLMLAAFLPAGLTPRLFVYGKDTDADVRSARKITDYLDMPLDHFDKGALRARMRGDRPDTETLLYYFDGWKEDGLLGHDIDLRDRLDRGARGSFMANGKCGEIYRHYYYLRIGKSGMTKDDLVRAVFARPVPHIMTDALAPEDFSRTIRDTFFGIAGFDEARVSQNDLDYLYSAVRLGNAAGRDITVNHRFSHALYPFVEAELCGPSAAATFQHKLYGRLEAHMIAGLDRGLADVETAYGFNMLEGPGLKYRLKMHDSYNRPAWLRHLLPRIQMRLQKPLSAEDRDLAGQTLLQDPSHPYMRRFFRIDAVHDLLTASRIAALELLGQHFGFER